MSDAPLPEPAAHVQELAQEVRDAILDLTDGRIYPDLMDAIDNLARAALSAAQPAQPDGDAKRLQRLAGWMRRKGLLIQQECKRPDDTFGWTWVVRDVAVVQGDSCLGWSAEGPHEAIDAAMRQEAEGVR